MKLFSPRQFVTLTFISLGCLLASSFIFDRIPRPPSEGTVRSCNNTLKLFAPKFAQCHDVTYMFRNYGWPFVAVRKSGVDDRLTFHNGSYSLDKYDSVYASYNTVVLLVISVIGYLFLKRFVFNRIAYTNPVDSPRIMSSDMLGEAGLTSLARGSTAGYMYNLLTNAAGRVMLNITLHNNTGMHIVASGSESISSLAFSEPVEGRFLKPVVLEGEFPEYFKLYCTPGKELELLEIFQPDTMWRLIDFCKAYQFEIFNDTLYVAQAKGANDDEDTTTLTADTETLLLKSGKIFDRLKA